MLKKIIIENYRSCLRTSFECHPNLSVLIGPNGSGKTNILQAIMFLNKLIQEGDREPHEDAITVSSRIRAVLTSGSIQTTLSTSVNAYADESNNDVLTASRQKWFIKRGMGQAIRVDLPMMAFTHFNDERMMPRQMYLFHHQRMHYRMAMRLPAKESPKWITSAVSESVRFCEGIRYYGASQFTNPGACPVSFEIEKEGKRQRYFRLRGHAKILYQMYMSQKAENRERYEQFFSIVGPKGLKLIDDLTFREVTTSSIEHTVRVGGKVEVRRRYKLLIVPQFRIGKHRLSPNQLSEGTFKTLALLFHITTEDCTALLIEEPEVCIHHGLLSSILEVIKLHSRRKQIIISTHSDYVLDHVSPQNVFRVSYERSAGTVVNHINKTMTAKELSALKEYLEKEGNLGEYWREGGLGDRR
ncbi:MAG: ATP-binding protein [Victivallales bacterium]